LLIVKSFLRDLYQKAGLPAFRLSQIHPPILHRVVISKRGWIITKEKAKSKMI